MFFSLKKSSFPLLVSLRRLKGNGEPDFEVVGTSFYRQNLESIRIRNRVQIGTELFIQLILRHDPENVHSPKRQAIGVYSAGLLLGHIPERSAEFFLAALTRADGIAKADARIWFGSDDIYGIRLSILWPPHFEDETAPKHPEKKLSGDGRFSLKLDSSGYRIDWDLMAKTANKVSGRRVLEIGETYESNDGTLWYGDFGRRADFSCIFGYVAKVPKSKDKEFHKLLNSLGGHLRVSYRLVRTGKTTHTVHIDFS